MCVASNTTQLSMIFVNVLQEELNMHQLSSIDSRKTELCIELGAETYRDDVGKDGWLGLKIFIYKGLGVVFNPRTEETELGFWVHANQEKIDKCIDTYNKMCVQRALRVMYEEEREGR